MDPSRPISPYNIEKTFKKLSQKYEVRPYPHMLRHLRATTFIKERMLERIVMKLLGHKTEKIMRVYVNLVNRNVEEVIPHHYDISLEQDNGNGVEALKCPRCGAGDRQ